MQNALSMPQAVAERWIAWDDLVESIPGGGFMQTSWWADFRVNAGYDHFAIIANHGGKMLGGAIVHRFACCEDSCFYYMPDGPLLPGDKPAAQAVLDAMLADIERRRKEEPVPVSHLRIEPRQECHAALFSAFRARDELSDPYMEPRTTLCIDLRMSEEDMLAQMKPKGRYNTRVAARHGVKVVEDNSAQGLRDFLSLYEDMTARQGIPPKPEDYFEDLVYQLSTQQRGTIYFAEHEGRRLAAAIVVWFGKTAVYFFGASLDERRHVMAPYRLHFEIMQRMKQRGLAWYDFWGVSPPGEEDHHHLGRISAFKRKFGGRDVSLPPTMDLVFDEAAYAGYKEETAD